MHFPATLTPAEFEEHVRRWLTLAGAGLNELEVVHLEAIEGNGGEYEMDVVARFTVLDGAQIIVLIECKHHRTPIKREVIQVLESKLRDTKAHKGMVFSTSSFQSGALEFAKAKGIATVMVSDAGAEYMTRSADSRPTPTPGHAVPWLLEPTERGHTATRVDTNYAEMLKAWVNI